MMFKKAIASMIPEKNTESEKNWRRFPTFHGL